MQRYRAGFWFVRDSEWLLGVRRRRSAGTGPSSAEPVAAFRARLMMRSLRTSMIIRVYRGRLEDRPAKDFSGSPSYPTSPLLSPVRRIRRPNHGGLSPARGGPVASSRRTAHARAADTSNTALQSSHGGGVFPARRLLKLPRTGERVRCHVHESGFQRAVAEAVRRAGIANGATCHSSGSRSPRTYGRPATTSIPCTSCRVARMSARR